MMVDKIVDSPTHLLELLDCRDFEEYQREFARLLEKEPDLQFEDWSSEPELLEVLYCLIRCKHPHTLMEIGTYKGKSAVVMANALQRNNENWGSIFTVDNNKSTVLDEAKVRINESSVKERIHLIENSSEQTFAEWRRAKIDLLFIDGSHSYLNVCCDFSLWSRHISTQGLIVMHDTVTRLERCFPKDYIHPLDYYDVLNVTDMVSRPSGHEWEGCGFIAHAGCLSKTLCG